MIKCFFILGIIVLSLFYYLFGLDRYDLEVPLNDKGNEIAKLRFEIEEGVVLSMVLKDYVGSKDGSFFLGNDTAKSPQNYLDEMKISVSGYVFKFPDASIHSLSNISEKGSGVTFEKQGDI